MEKQFSHFPVPAAVELNGLKIAGLWRGESFNGRRPCSEP
jgi:hypothetical protein